MPVITPLAPTYPFDTIETILNFTRVIANDCGLSLAGNLLSDNQPYTYPMLTLAWRKLQDRIGNNNVELLPEEAIIPQIPVQIASQASDPTINCYIDYKQYFDGEMYYPAWFIPSNLEIPLRLWQRVSGRLGEFIPIPHAIDGISSLPKTGLIREWEWRNNKIYFPGATQVLDLRIRYKKLMDDPDYEDVTTNMIPLANCAVALAYLVVEIFAAGRGSTMLPAFLKEKEDAIKQVINRTTRKNQRINFRRIPYSRRGR